MTRNESALDFQKRLIQTALKSPREESVKMLGIVYSNLKEFVQVRVPLDKHPDEIIDKFFEVLELFDAALQKKHSMAYISNDPAYILESVQTTNIIFGRPITEASKNDPNAKAAVYKFLEWYYESGDIDIYPGYGCFIDGNYFRHHAIVQILEYALDIVGEPETDTEAFLKFRTDSIVRCDEICGRRTKISAPEHGPVTDNHAAYRVQKWLNKSSKVNVRIRFEQNPDAEHQFIFRKDRIGDDEYVYTVVYRNDLFLDYDVHAKNILKYLNRTHDISLIKDLKYKDLDDNSIFGYMHGMTMFDTYNRETKRFIPSYARGPFDNHAILGEICLSLNMIEAFGLITKESNDQETIISKLEEYRRNRIMHRINPGLDECYLTIYRTGHDYDDVNRKFILLMAIMLEKNCHVYIEARARGDEQSNLNLYRELAAIGADVHIVAKHYPDYKVHAKAWTFITTNGYAPAHRTYLSVYSTGNFVESAQKGFVDSVYFERGCVDDESEIPGVRLWNDLMDDSGEHKWTSISDKLVWEPKKIRKTIVDLIRRQTVMNDPSFRHVPQFHDLHEYKPFIWIKVNHITDSKTIKALTRAANAGVDVRILARTTCTIPSRTSKIKIRSIAGKYLEHDRFYIFGLYRENGEGKFGDIIAQDSFISSCDLMERNLDKRIEFLYKLDDDEHYLGDLFMKIWNRETDPRAGYFRYTI